MIPEGTGTFRRDIEGLRAVAVMAVVAYHAGMPLAGGGFVGVDVFFVISGFLITGLLLTELRTTGTVRLAAFWARRARRLLPAAAAVLLVTTVGVVYLLPAVQQEPALRDVAGAAVFLANWRFVRRGVDYLNSDAQPSVVLHYWSLGVEEQFYLLWPVLLLAVALLTRRAARHRTAVLAIALTAIWVGSFAACWYFTYAWQPFAFFGLPTRAWQLATGALIAVGAARLARLPAGIRVPMGWAGLAAIAVAIGTLSEGGELPYPGLAALLPTLATAAVLAAGCGTLPAAGPAAALGWAPLQAIGRVSYSWYLWHWPPLVLVPLAVGMPLRLPLGLAIAAASLGVAFASYRWIEQPVRHAPVLVRRTGLALAVGAVLTVVPAAVGIGVAHALEARSVRTVTVADSAATGGVRHITFDLTPLPHLRDVSPLLLNGCQAGYRVETPRQDCVFGDEGSPRRMVLFGDSHASQWFPALDAAADRTGLALATRTKSACSPAEVTVVALDEPYPACDVWRERVLADLERDPPEVVVVAGMTGQMLQPIIGPGGKRLDDDPALRRWQEGLERTLRRLQATGSRVVLLRDTPAMGTDVRECLADEGVAEACAVPRAEAVTEPAPDVEVARRVGVQVWDLTDEVCSPTVCHAVVGDTIAWYDDDHLSASFSTTLAEEFTGLLRASGAA